MSEKPVLRLFSDGLLSKWGFGDGDVPEALLDYCDERGLPYPEDWHATLRKLVHERLVPALEQDVELAEIDTIHNPIRAGTVNGVPVDWYADAEDNPLLAPESVSVPYDEVLRMAGVARA